MQKSEDPRNSKGSKLVAKIPKQLDKLKLLIKSFPEYETDVLKREKMYTKLLSDLKESEIPIDELHDILNALYNHLKRLKQRINAKLKFSRRDVDVSMERYKALNKGFLPFYAETKFVNPNAKSADSVTIEDIARLDFDMLSYTIEELNLFAFKIFKFLNYHTSLGIKDETLKGLIREISDNYNIVPYHHFTHGFSVFQMFFVILKKSNIKPWMSDAETFISLISALAHDLNHKAVNNGWHIKEKSNTSTTFAESAVLENFHIATFFRIMKERPEFAIFEQITNPNTKNELKRMLVTNILATDMTKHGRMVQKLTRRIKATFEYEGKIEAGMEIGGPLRDNAFLSERYEDRRYITNTLIHACDIGNPCLPYDMYHPWAVLITQEFDSQTIKEEKHGLEVTGFLKCKSRESFLNGQMFFSKSLVYPLWAQVKLLFSGLGEFTDNIDENLKKLKEEKDKLAA